jgi:flavin reductase (DIM6/NTAB) family NADH-FMN oxidoreductase RutF
MKKNIKTKDTNSEDVKSLNLLENMRSILPTRVSHILSPRLTVLVTSGTMDQGNIMTVSWNMPVSIHPPLISIAVHPERYTYALIKEIEEFCINIPPATLLEKVFRAGTESGVQKDKFKELGLTKIKARRVSVPLIGECIGFIECRLVDEIKPGDHYLLIGSVESIYIREEVFDGKGIDPRKLLYWRDSQRKDDVWSLKDACRS